MSKFRLVDFSCAHSGPNLECGPENTPLILMESTPTISISQMRTRRHRDVKCFFVLFCFPTHTGHCSQENRSPQWTGHLSSKVPITLLFNSCFPCQQPPESAITVPFSSLKGRMKWLWLPNVCSDSEKMSWSTRLKLLTCICAHPCTHPCIHSSTRTPVACWVDSHFCFRILHQAMCPAMLPGSFILSVFSAPPRKKIYSKPSLSAPCSPVSVFLLHLEGPSGCVPSCPLSCCFEASPPPACLPLLTSGVMRVPRASPCQGLTKLEMPIHCLELPLTLPHWTSLDFINSRHQLEKWGVSRIPFSRSPRFVKIKPLK